MHLSYTFAYTQMEVFNMIFFSVNSYSNWGVYEHIIHYDTEWCPTKEESFKPKVVHNSGTNTICLWLGCGGFNFFQWQKKSQAMKDSEADTENTVLVQVMWKYPVREA